MLNHFRGICTSVHIRLINPSTLHPGFIDVSGVLRALGRESRNVIGKCEMMAGPDLDKHCKPCSNTQQQGVA